MSEQWELLLALGLPVIALLLTERERRRQRRAVGQAAVIVAQHLGEDPRFDAGSFDSHDTLRGNIGGVPVAVRLWVGWHPAGSGARRQDCSPVVRIEMPVRAPGADFSICPRGLFPGATWLRNTWLRATVGSQLAFGDPDLDAQFVLHGTAPALTERARDALKRSRGLWTLASAGRRHARVERGRACFREVLVLGERRFNGAKLAEQVWRRVLLLALLADAAEAPADGAAPFQR
jgi:hypothetical protein